MSLTPNTDLWFERSRLAGMIFAAVSYGVFLLLTLQTTAMLTRRHANAGQTLRHRGMLLGYVWLTFVLATIGFAGNARFTEMIWIDLRDTPGGPVALISKEMDYWVNMMALTCYYLMEWLMQALLLYRCVALWEWKKRVAFPMVAIFLAMVATSIVVLAQASGAIFYDIRTQIAYLSLQVGLTLFYTCLVVGRLVSLENKEAASVERKDVLPEPGYTSATIMVVESAALYAPVGILFLVSFVVGSNVTNLVFLSVSHVQGIAQLWIVERIARGDGKGVFAF